MYAHNGMHPNRKLDDNYHTIIFNMILEIQSLSYELESKHLTQRQDHHMVLHLQLVLCSDKFLK